MIVLLKTPREVETKITPKQSTTFIMKMCSPWVEGLFLRLPEPGIASLFFSSLPHLSLINDIRNFSRAELDLRMWDIYYSTSKRDYSSRYRDTDIVPCGARMSPYYCSFAHHHLLESVNDLLRTSHQVYDA